MATKKKSLNEQAKEIMQLAEENGVQNNMLFVTTFKRYQVQLKILADLEKELADGEVLVSKEYVKGRKNLYTNPVVTAYNSTTDSANRTATTLHKLMQDWAKKESDEEVDPLLKILNGGGAE